MLALCLHGDDGGLFEDLCSDELGGFFGVVGVFDERECVGGVGEFRDERSGLGVDGVDAVADSSAAGVDFGGGALGEFLGKLGVGFEELWEVREGGGDGFFARLACNGIDVFEVIGLVVDGCELGGGETGEEVGAVEGGG